MAGEAVVFETNIDSYTTAFGVGSSELKASIILPTRGHYWEIEQFYVVADDTFSAQNTNYGAFLLKDSSGNTIGTVTNGPSSGGLDIDAAGTGVDTSMTAAYKFIDCRSSVDEIYVQVSDVGAGVVYTGLKFLVMARPYRQ